MPAKKGQAFNKYSKETKKEAVRLRMEESWTYSQIMEKLYLEKPQNLEQARSQITEYISFYNMERFQNKLGDLSPIEFRKKVAA
ncbi:IS3 family transposase [Paenibacillus pabuli]|uniref:IS3 family transposase n=1 Tax=Paenibacillus pabuli TaxID=1472 RepID=UPI00206FFDA1|nr:IS3 family transposase [Paenibacillus pabuli]